VGSKFSRIAQLSPSSLKIIPIWSLKFFQFDFDTKVYFYYFSIPGLEEKRERLLNSDNERENPPKWLFLIFTVSCDEMILVVVIWSFDVA